jgi:hypothetical protein
MWGAHVSATHLQFRVNVTTQQQQPQQQPNNVTDFYGNYLNYQNPNQPQNQF